MIQLWLFEYVLFSVIFNDFIFFSKYFNSSNCILKLVGDSDNDYGNELRYLVNKLNLDNKVKFIGIQTGNNKE